MTMDKIENLKDPIKIWKKGQRSAYDFYLRGYQGAWLLSDGRMLTYESGCFTEDDHWSIYVKYAPLLKKWKAIRMSRPNMIQIYFFPISEDQREEISRLFAEEIRLQERRDAPGLMWWDFSYIKPRDRNWYDTPPLAIEESDANSFGDFLRALQNFEKRITKHGKRNRRQPSHRKTKRSRGSRVSVSRRRATA